MLLAGNYPEISNPCLSQGPPGNFPCSLAAPGPTPSELSLAFPMIALTVQRLGPPCRPGFTHGPSTGGAVSTTQTGRHVASVIVNKWADNFEPPPGREGRKGHSTGGTMPTFPLPGVFFLPHGACPFQGSKKKGINTRDCGGRQQT